MKKIITICLVFYSIGLLAQLAPFSRSKGGSISGPPTPITETDPLAVKLVGNDLISGTKTFQFGAPVEATTKVNGKTIELNDQINTPDITVSVECDKMVITDGGSGSMNSIYPSGQSLQSGAFANNFYYNYWIWEDGLGNSIEAVPSGFGVYTPSGNVYMNGGSLQLNRPVKTSPINNEAINYLETKKLFVSRSIQDTCTAPKIFTSGYIKVNGGAGVFSNIGGNSITVYDPVNDRYSAMGPTSITIEDANLGTTVNISSNKMLIADRAGYVPTNKDVLVKEEVQALVSPLPNTVVFTSSGTYTPTPGMRYIEVEMIGGGGGSGCAAESTGIGNQRVSGSAGAGAGGYAKFRMTAAQVGASVTVTVGAGGLGATTITTPTAGANGGTTSFGASNVCTGGAGSSSAPVDSVAQVIGAAGGSCTIGAGTQIIKVPGGNGDDLFGYYTGRISLSQADSPEGGNSYYGQGGRNRKLLIISGTAFWGVGETPTGIYGAGASGWYYINNAGSYGGNAGSNGAPGIVTIKEYF